MQTNKPLTLRTILCFCDHDGQLSTVFAWADNAYRCLVTPRAYAHIFTWPETTQRITNDGIASLLVDIEGCMIEVYEVGGAMTKKDIPK